MSYSNRAADRAFLCWEHLGIPCGSCFVIDLRTVDRYSGRVNGVVSGSATGRGQRPGYYAKECPQVTATASQIPWALDDGIGTMLPVMQSDITLTQGSTVLIIDAKYYTYTTQAQYNVHTLHSGNLYQIFTYVKNKDAEFGTQPHTVSGMLLYAATDEAIQPNNSYRMSGNKISVKTLDLNRDFSEIAAQLNAIVDEYFSD